MIKIIFLSLLATLLFAQNPRAYSVIGTPIYDNVQNILSLKHISEFEEFELRLDNYYFDVDEVKDRGFEIDGSKKKINSKDYLLSLRTLKKTNDFFLKLAQGSFHASMKDEDSQLFSEIINTGLIDTKKHKKEIIKYYFKHIDEIDARGVIQVMLDDDEKLRLQREAYLRSLPTKQQLIDVKIKRIQDRDKAKKLAREKALQKELADRKATIRANQKRELSH